MAEGSYQVTAFFGGEWSKFVQGRNDLPAYKTAMNVCLNNIPIEPGTCVRRPGTRLVGATFGGRAGRLIPFTFTEQQPYQIVFVDSEVQFVAGTPWTTYGVSKAQTLDPNTVTSVTSANPGVFTTATNHGWSSNDHVVFPFAPPDVLLNREFVLTVLSPDTFTIFDQVTGDLFDGSLITSFPIGGFQVARVLGFSSPYGAPGTSTGLDLIRRVQAETTAIFLHPVVAPYFMTALTLPNNATHSYATFSAIAPASFVDGPYLDQYVGTVLTPSGTTSPITLTTSGSPFPGFKSNDVGRLLRIFSAPPAWDSGHTYAKNDVVSVYSDPVNQPGSPAFYVATAATTNNFPPISGSVWSPVAAQGGIGAWLSFTISSVNASNQIVVTGPSLYYITTIYAWRLGAYGGDNGYPTCGVYSDGRLWLGGAIPNRIDASVANGVNGGIINMAPTNGDGTVGAANAINATFTAKDSNKIVWMAQHQQGVLCGTQAGEWLVFAPGSGSIAPNNIDAKRVTKIGGVNTEVAEAELTLLFVHRAGRKVMEYFADVFSGKFAGPHLSFTWKHLTRGGIAEIAYQQELAPILWVRRNDGTLIGCTYKRESLASAQGPTIAGGHKHTLGSGRLVESIAVGPSAGGTSDSLMMITNDSTSNIRYIEVLTDIPDEDATPQEWQYLDAAIAPTISQALATQSMPYGGLTCSGLWPHNGKTVTAYIGGLDCGDYEVINGAFTVPYGDGISGGTANGLFTASYVASIPAIPIWIGYSFTSQGQVVRANAPADTGARVGGAFAKFGRAHRLGLQLEGAITNSIMIGTDFKKMYPVKFQTDGLRNYPITQQFSGIYRDRLEDTYSFDSMPCWRITRPYSCNMISLGPSMYTQDD